MSMLVKWKGGMAFEASTETGHQILMDGAPEIGGANLGARPMEMLLAGLGGCSGIDVMMMLQKGGQDVRDCQIEITSERAETIPKVFTKIHAHYKVVGKDLSDKKVQRAVDLSAEKYCSVSKMLEAMAEMTHSFEVVDA